jgi:hypothetical protein
MDKIKQQLTNPAPASSPLSSAIKPAASSSPTLSAVVLASDDPSLSGSSLMPKVITESGSRLSVTEAAVPAAVTDSEASPLQSPPAIQMPPSPALSSTSSSSSTSSTVEPSQTIVSVPTPKAFGSVVGVTGGPDDLMCCLAIVRTKMDASVRRSVSDPSLSNFSF